MFTHRDHLSLDLDPLRIAFNLIVWILSFKEASSCRNDKHLARLSCSTVLVKYHAFECTRLKATAQFITSLKLGVDRCIACRKASSTVITLVFLHPTSVGQECVVAPVHREVNQLHISLIWRGWTAVRAYWFAWCALSSDAGLSHNGDLQDNRVVIVVYSFCPYFEYMDVICHCLNSTLRVTNYQQAG